MLRRVLAIFTATLLSGASAYANPPARDARHTQTVIAAVVRQHASVLRRAAYVHIKQHGGDATEAEVEMEMAAHLAEATAHGGAGKILDRALAAVAALRAQPPGTRDVAPARQKLNLAFAYEQGQLRGRAATDAYISAVMTVARSLKELDELDAEHP